MPSLRLFIDGSRMSKLQLNNS